MARLIDYFPSWANKGIFNSDIVMGWTPWWDSLTIADKNGLDLEYFGNRSGYKWASPLIDKIASTFDIRTIDTSTLNFQALALHNAIKGMYGEDWKKMWEVWNLDYDPIYNYNMTEDFKGKDKGDKTTETETASKSRTEMDVVNSVKPLNTNTFESLSKTDTDSETTRQKSNNTSKETEGSTGENEYLKHRFGNIGTLAYQDMVKRELDLRRQHFFDIIMTDLDKVLTIPYWR